MYLLLIHSVLVIVLMKTDFIFQVRTKLGHKVTVPELTYNYKNMLAYHQRIDKNIPDKSIVFIGDSMIQGLAVSAISPQAVNFGIGQDTTLGVINRIPLYTSLERSKLIIFAVGVNDLGRRSNKQIIENYRHIINIIPNQTPVLFSAVLPVHSKDLSINKRIHGLNKHLKDLCQERDDIYFLDISNHIINSDGSLDVKYHIGDGLHLNELGNTIWIDKLKKYINIIRAKN